MAYIPRSVWDGSFTLFGVEVHCHVLDDGERIIETGSVEALLGAIAGSNEDLDIASVDEFARWLKGQW